jgi:hypothetical protein
MTCTTGHGPAVLTVAAAARQRRDARPRRRRGAAQGVTVEKSQACARSPDV